MYPGNPLKLSVDDILNHYKGNGLKPVSKNGLNAMIREQYLSLKETYAFAMDLAQRGIAEDDGSVESLRRAYEAMEGYVEYLDSFSYPKTEGRKSSV